MLEIPPDRVNKVICLRETADFGFAPLKLWSSEGKFGGGKNHTGAAHAGERVNTEEAGINGGKRYEMRKARRQGYR